MRKLILMAGVPGTGKSSWAYAYAKEHPNTFVVDTDETRKEITGSYKIFTKPVSIAHDAMIAKANKYLSENEDCTVIIDSTFLDDERRTYFLDRLKGYDFLEHVMIKFHDYSIVYRRNKERKKEKWVPEEVIDAMIAKYKDPSPEVAKRFDKITVEYWN